MYYDSYLDNLRQLWRYWTSEKISKSIKKVRDICYLLSCSHHVGEWISSQNQSHDQKDYGYGIRIVDEPGEITKSPVMATSYPGSYLR